MVAQKISTLIKTLGVDEYVDVGHVRITLLHIDAKSFTLHFENLEPNSHDQKKQYVSTKKTFTDKKQININTDISVISYKKNSNVKRCILVISAPREIQIRHFDKLKL